MIMQSKRSRRHGAKLPRSRRGVSLVEVVVSCTLLALALTGLTGVSVRMSERTRNVAVSAQRTAILAGEINRTDATPYDSLATTLVSDSLLQGPRYYVWNYVVGAESTTVASGTDLGRFRSVNITVTPRTSTAGAQSIVIRRSKPPVYNPLLMP